MWLGNNPLSKNQGQAQLATKGTPAGLDSRDNLQQWLSVLAASRSCLTKLHKLGAWLPSLKVSILRTEMWPGHPGDSYYIAEVENHWLKQQSLVLDLCGGGSPLEEPFFLWPHEIWCSFLPILGLRVAWPLSLVAHLWQWAPLPWFPTGDWRCLLLFQVLCGLEVGCFDSCFYSLASV